MLHYIIVYHVTMVVKSGDMLVCVSTIDNRPSSLFIYNGTWNIIGICGLLVYNIASGSDTQSKHAL